jgi:hypothetical protein
MSHHLAPLHRRCEEPVNHPVAPLAAVAKVFMIT